MQDISLSGSEAERKLAIGLIPNELGTVVTPVADLEMPRVPR